MTLQPDQIARKHRFALFRSVRNKLLFLMIALSLLPLIGMSFFAYSRGKSEIQERISLSLKKMAQDTADKIDLLLSGKKEEIHSMATTYPLIYHGVKDADRKSLIALLNNYCFNSNEYDVLAILDKSGKIIGINTVDRNLVALPEQKVASILGSDISRFAEEKKLFSSSITGHNDHHDWYQSKLVQSLYDYGDDDRSHQFNIAFSEPISNPETHEIIGVWINILNWSYFQAILDSVEMDLASMNLRSGLSFMTAKDGDTIIGHKWRLNRQIDGKQMTSIRRDFYQRKFSMDYGLRDVRDDILKKKRDLKYALEGNKKISGMASIDDLSLGWNVGVEVDEQDVARPIKNFSYWLLGAAALLGLLVIVFTYVIAEGIAVPLKTLIHSASTIAKGNYNDRVQIRSSDEMGVLASTFNEMAQALSYRETQLQDLNKNLESMVRDRTLELENSHEALKRAYFDLQNAQEQLIQTEKMASLGQLVAGIAHEIKNPLNFIYGNTGFLSDYSQKLQNLVDAFENLPSMSEEDREKIAKQKEIIHYSFIKDDLKILIDNFTEGARRINAIVTDLRTFSRMDADSISEVDVHASIEMSLNLLRNQYKNRIEIHKEYGDIPKIPGFVGKLNQVFMNLLSNAFHAIQGQGDVWIRTRLINDFVEIQVEDSGSGIPKEILSRIFEPFFTTKPVGQGTGLGLSISYGIIEQHKGCIHVVSEPNKGSSFVVNLPVDQEKAS